GGGASGTWMCRGRECGQGCLPERCATPARGAAAHPELRAPWEVHRKTPGWDVLPTVRRYGKLPITALPPPPLGGRGLLSSPAEGSAALAWSCGTGSPRQRRVARWKNRLLGTRSTLSPPAGWVSSSVT